ncbi:hypothetical protein NG819_02870 [Pseudarthrobacter sp. Fe7]|nr:hypothetical protein NG819_02870 [Pseudarthrobacter sp. Fe7]
MSLATASRAVKASAIALTAILALSACATSAGNTATPEAGTFAKDSSTLIIGMVPDESSATSTWQPVADYVAKVTGKRLRSRNPQITPR